MGQELETVKQEAARRGVSVSQVRKDRQERAELQPERAPYLCVGRTYQDGLGRAVEIVAHDATSERPFVAKGGERFDARGRYADASFVHLLPLNLVRELC